MQRQYGNRDFFSYGYVSPEDIPPFLPIGGDTLTRVNTSTHDEYGVITKDPVKVDRALRDLSEKIEARKSDLEYVNEDIEAGADTIIIAYGLAARTSREVVQTLRGQGKKISLLTIYSVWPVPETAIKRAPPRSLTPSAQVVHITWCWMRLIGH